MTNSEKLYQVAKLNIGKKLVSDAEEGTGCVIAYNVNHRQALGYVPTDSAYTGDLLNALISSSSFVECKREELKRGGTVIAASETRNGVIKHGHVCISGDTGLMSNNSSTGEWHENYSIDHFIAVFEKRDGLIVRFFNKI